MTKKSKRSLIRIIVAAVLFSGQLSAELLIPDLSFYITAFLLLTSYITVGYDVLWKAVKNIFHGSIFDENFLMSLATIGAIALCEYREAVAVMLFYQVGELFQSFAVNKSRRSVSALMNIRPDYANLLTNGESRKVNPEEVHTGDLIVIYPGERIPLDGIAIGGSTTIDNSALTGESLPVSVNEGDTVLSGGININGVITVEVTSEYRESTVSKILELAENAGAKKSKAENFITRFAAWYTPLVVMCALLLAVIPPIVTHTEFFGIWLERALTFLVVSCPCALVISVPLSFFGGIGGASKAGILIKGGINIETLEKVRTVVFDKTGTLTEGSFSVTKIHTNKISADGVLKIAAHCEAHSNHPIALSIKNAYSGEIDLNSIGKVEELSGLGICADFNGKRILAGNRALMERYNINCPEYTDEGTMVYIAENNEYLGCIVISDKIKPDAKTALAELKKAGIKNTFMLTGDSKSVAERVGNQLGIGKIYSSLLPSDKVECLEKIIDSKAKGTAVAYAGDGINDAPVLAMADVGVAMGGIGSDAAIEAADVVIMTDEPSKIAQAIKISRRTMKIVRENIIFALTVKIAILILAALGYSGMWAAVFADVGVAVIAITNALRTLKAKL